MNFFFPTASSTTPSSSPLSSTPSKFSTTPQNVQARTLHASTVSSPPSPFTPLAPASNTTAEGGSSTNLPDVDLSIEVDPSFHGILLGVPEESPGAVIYVTIVLHVRRKPIRATKLQTTFDGRIKVQCSDGATFGHDQQRERVLAHRDWTLWEASSNSSMPTGGESKNHIPIGTHYYPLSIQLDGALPPSFSGKHGSIRYFLSAVLMRPLFYSDVHTLHELPLGRCLVPEEGSGPQSSLEEGVAPGLSLLPGIGSTATITHHNTHKELLRYTASSPPIAFLDREMIQLDLALEPLPPGSRIHSISYGLKEIIRYQSSTSGNSADNRCEILYPLGQQTVIIPRDPERERTMSNAGAGASTRQLLELRTDPDLVNVDMITSLIDIQHRLTCNVAVVLEDPGKRANAGAVDISGSSVDGPTRNGSSQGGGGASDGQRQGNNSHTGVFSGGGILRRLNLAPQPLAPTLDLVDSTGSTVVNNAVLLGEPTSSIIAPVPAPATIELNDAPPPPPANLTESTVLEFPIILTSRHPRVTQGMQPQANPPSSQHSQRRPSHQLQQQQQLYSVPHQPNVSSAAPSAQPLQQQQHVLHIPQRQGNVGGGTAMYSPGPDGDDGHGQYQALGIGIPSSVSSSIIATSLPMSVPASSPPVVGMVTRTEASQSRPFFNNNSNNTDDSHRFPATHHPLHHHPFPTRSGISAGLQAAAAATGALSAVLEPTPSTGRNTQMEEEEEPPKYEDVVNHDLQQLVATSLSLQQQQADAVAESPSIPSSTRTHRGPIDMVRQRPQQPSFPVSSSYQASPPTASSSFQSNPMSFSPSSATLSSPFFTHRQSPPTTRDTFLASSLPPSLIPQTLSTSPTAAPPTGVMGFRGDAGGGHVRTGSTTSVLAGTTPFVTRPPTAQSIPIRGGGSVVRSATTRGGGGGGGSRHRRQTSVNGTTTSSIMIESLASHGGYLSQTQSPLPPPDIETFPPVSRSLPATGQFVFLDATGVSGDHAEADGSPPRYRPTTCAATPSPRPLPPM